MQSVKNTLAKTSKDRILVIMRGLNIFNGLLLATACVFAFTIIEGSITRFFLALYIGIFALLLLAFELRVNRAEQSIKRFFGFMYTYMGRTTFLLFLGAINFGMIDDSNKGTDGRTVVILVGIATVANAAFNCLVICNHPAFVGEKKSKPMTEEEIIAYIKEHPEVAAKAAAGASGDTKIDVFGAPAGPPKSSLSASAPVMAPAPVPAPASAPAHAASTGYVPPDTSGFSSVPLSPAATSAPVVAVPAPAPSPSPAPAPAAAPAAALPPPLPPRNKKKSGTPTAAAGEPNPFNPDNPFE